MVGSRSASVASTARQILLAALAMLSPVSGAAESPAEPSAEASPEASPESAAASRLPWRAVDDPLAFSSAWSGARAGLRSSYDARGKRFDRHSAGDERFLRVEDGEGVLLDLDGAGAITRIWMTTGVDTSSPLPTSVRLRVYFDGAGEPAIDVPLRSLFDGSTPPFLPPLVADPPIASGGNVSLVPLPFRRGCKMTLVGAEETMLFFQISFLRLDGPSAAAVETFDAAAAGDADRAPLRRLLGRAAEDPWTGAAPAGDIRRVAHEGRLETGEEWTLFDSTRDRAVDSPSAAGAITALRLRMPAERWHDVRLRARFGGTETIDLTLADLFARSGGERPLESLFLRNDPVSGSLLTYLPMPCPDGCSLRLVTDGPQVAVSAAVRFDRRPPPAPAGRLRVVATDERLDPADLVASKAAGDRASGPEGHQLDALRLQGAGRWVGTVATLGDLPGGEPSHRAYLEGDERVWIDGALRPTLHGTGIEDFFGGGFYFDRGVFVQPLFAMIHQGPTPSRAPAGSQATGEPKGAADSTKMLRFQVADAVPYRDGLVATWEAGPTGKLPMTSRTVAFVYEFPALESGGNERGESPRQR